MSGCLYVVGTPIGNLGDMSPRAVQTLNEVDFIAAEDTRVTIKLLNHFDIKKHMISYHEHNRYEKGQDICRRILNGENCALVTDAGMPAISDPGEDLVKMCHSMAIPVRAVPGPTAFATAIAVSGLACGRFTFEGFLSVNKKSRREHLEQIVHEKRTMIFYEAPHKLKNTLADMLKVLGDRDIVLVRELTKVHEEIINTTFSKALEMYDIAEPKGEFVMIVSGESQTENDDNDEVTLEQAVILAKGYMASGDSAAMAAKKAAKQTGCRKSEIYKNITTAEDE